MMGQVPLVGDVEACDLASLRLYLMHRTLAMAFYFICDSVSVSRGYPQS